MSGWSNRVTPLRTHDGNSVIFCPGTGPEASSLSQFYQATECRVSQERSTIAGSQHGSLSAITVSKSPIDVPACPCKRPHVSEQLVHQWDRSSCVPIGKRPTIRFALAFGWREAKVGFGAPSTYPLCVAPSRLPKTCHQYECIVRSALIRFWEDLARIPGFLVVFCKEAETLGVYSGLRLLYPMPGSK